MASDFNPYDWHWDIANTVAYPYTHIAALCWLIVMGCCIAGALSSSWRETLLVHIALWMVAGCSLSRAFWVIGRGSLPFDAVALAASLALLSVAMVLQHKRNLKHRRRRASDMEVPGQPQRRRNDASTYGRDDRMPPAQPNDQ